MIYTITLNPAIDRTIMVDAINNDDVTRVKKTIRQAAGKGINISMVLKKLHQESIVGTFLAGDNGLYIEDQLAKKYIPYISVKVKGNTRENIKVLPKEHAVVELNEQGPNCTENDVSMLVEKISSIIKKDDIIVFTGSIPKGLQKDTYKRLIEIFNQKQVRTVLDASGDNLRNGIEGIPNIIKPNLYELSQYFNVNITSIEDAIIYGQKLRDKGIEEVLITMGKDGSVLISDEVFLVDPIKVNAKNTVGAGDSFLAGYIHALEEGLKKAERLSYATATAVSSVMYEGTGPKNCEDIESIRKQVHIKQL